MAKNVERRRTMVYSNVNKNKKADKKSASIGTFENSNKRDVINLDDEIVIGLAKLPEPNKSKEKKSKKKNNIKNNGNDDLKKLWENEKQELAREESGENKKQSIFQKFKSLKSKKTDDDDEFDEINPIIEKNNSKPKGKINNKINNNQIKSSNIKKEKVNHKEISVNIPQKQKALNIQERIRKQKMRIIRKLTVIALLIILLIGGIIYFMLSPVFNVKNINVINNTNISSEIIINSSKIKKDENMFKFSKREAKKSILSNPYIEDVKIKRKLFNTIEIDVKERYASLMLEYGNSFVYINNQGYILEISTEKLNVPMITGYVTELDKVKPGNRLSKEDLERLTTVLKIMEVANSNGIGDLITKIDVKSKKNYVLTFDTEDKVVYLGECIDLSTQMLFVKEMLKREKGIEGEFFINMDLNTNKPVFREKV